MTSSEELVSRVEFEPVRGLFQDEAQQFTPWLETHVECLAERLGIQLSVAQREEDVGDFRVDLLCEDGDGRLVIIENQLDKTDHDHLGKLLTYLVNLDAGAAIWVTPEPRPEHQKVIDWLNEATPADISFYLVKVEAVRIAGSPLALLFTAVTAPDRQAKEVGKKKKELAERHLKRRDFWMGLLEKSRERTGLFSNISPSYDNWITTGAGKSGISFCYGIWMDRGGVELYIDHDTETGAKNKAIFDALYLHKAEVESDFGEALEWERLDHRRASRVQKRFACGGLASAESWPSLQDKMIDAMIRLDKAFRHRLAKVNA